MVVARPVVVEAGQPIVLPPGELKRLREARIRRRPRPERLIRVLVHHTARPVADRDRISSDATTGVVSSRLPGRTPVDAGCPLMQHPA